MTEIKQMTAEELAELAGMITRKLSIEDGAEPDESLAELPDDMEALGKMADEIRERKAEIENARQARETVLQRVADIGVTTKAPEKKEDKKTMTEIEMRGTQEYAKAYLHLMKSGDDKECRALLSLNAASGGYVPVPTFLETEIKNAWEEHKLLSLCKHSYFKGNVKVGFELSATGAAVHAEGAAAPSEETLTLGVVEIKAANIKKWISVSDEALEGTTVDTMGYIFREIAHKITEKAEELLVGLITTAPTTATATAVNVSEMTASALAIDTLVNMLALLSSQARDITIAMNRGTYAAIRALQLNAKYAADPFDGLKDRVVFTDKLPSFSSASANDFVIVAGDFGYGAQANFPAGNDISILTDNLSLAERDLVKIVGRQYVGMGIVAPSAFVRLKKVAAG